ncbi:MAG: bifunctional transcriptional activator/DNA repair enzyme AdaA, partial [Acidimicrobiales bacterium]
MIDQEHCYRAVLGKDARFDGVFFSAVTSTGIYCRPSCPAVTPKRSHMVFYPSAAAAQDAGFRACKRCRPDASPGSPEWNWRADVAGRAVRLIGDGVVDREGVAGLARRLGYGERQLHRSMIAELGAGPLALARAQRAQTARILLETTELAMAQVAFAAGFASIRQFNATIREVFDATPTRLRAHPSRRRDANGGARSNGTLNLRLPLRPPIDFDRLLGFLGARAVPGVEAVEDGVYRRALGLPHGTGVVALSAGAGPYLQCGLQLADLRDLAAAVQRCRRLFDLDCDPAVVSELLGRDALLGPSVSEAPGRRVPGGVDGGELAIRAVLGQQISVAGARTLAARLTARHGAPLDEPRGPVTHCFPTPEA